MKPMLVAVILAVSSLALVGNAWGQSQGGQRQKSSMDTFLQWSSEQVNQIRNSCGRWMTDLERRWSDSDTQINDSATPSATTQNQLPGNRSNTRQDGVNQGQEPASGQGMGTGTAFGTGGGRGSGSGPASSFGNASGRGKRGTMNGQGARGNGQGARGNGQESRGRGKGRRSSGRGQGQR